jgi:Secretion system C-terminal sorting domain
MKKFFCLLCLYCSLSSRLSAQWTYDPNNPTIVCNATGTQSLVQTIHDGNGGFFVFWSDKRASSNKAALYGQHYNQYGVELWQSNGRQIWADTNSALMSFSVIKNAEGNLLYGISKGVSSSGDTILVFKTDTAANHLWSQPVLVAGKSGTINFATKVQVVEKDSGVYVGYFLTASGNNPKLYINRVDKNGSLLWGFQGISVPLSGYGGFGMIPDSVGGLFLYWRNSNGSGSGLGVRRITENGTFLWSGNVNPAAGTLGLGYDYRAISDNNYGIILAWTEAGANIKMSRVDSSGTLSWTPSIVTVCGAAQAQDQCRIIKNANNIYVAWNDNRPAAPSSNIYMQQFDMNGVPQWTMDGVLCTSPNGSGVYSDMTNGDSSSIIFSYEATGTGSGFYAQKIYPDSTLAWNAPGAKFSSASLAPNSAEYVLLTTSDSGALAIWVENGNIYANKVGTNGTITGIENPVNSQTSFVVFPNPTSERVVLKFNDEIIDDKLQVSIYDESGRCVFNLDFVNANAGNKEISVLELANGFYTLILKGKHINAHSRLVILK